jgi:hypothetical protein
MGDIALSDSVKVAHFNQMTRTIQIKIQSLILMNFIDSG